MSFTAYCPVAQLERLIQQIDIIDSGFRDMMKDLPRKSQRLAVRYKLSKLTREKKFDLIDWEYVKGGKH
jgi:hypothetical protein